MTVTPVEVQAVVDRVNEVALPAEFGGHFWDKFDAWLFANAGAEIRYYLRIVGEELVLTNAQRSETVEQLVFASPLLSDMEKFLTYHFSDSLRWRRRLPMLLVVPIPVTIDKVAPGFTIVDPGESDYELHQRGDEVIRRGDRTDLVEFSHYVGLTPEEIRESALDPEGKPHFMIETYD